MNFFGLLLLFNVVLDLCVLIAAYDVAGWGPYAVTVVVSMSYGFLVMTVLVGLVEAVERF